MILEGFEIENWSCIKKLSVTGLPATGVIVLHGPNRTGKSSIVQALRSCLMDYPSTTAALKSYYPRGTGEKPVVTVTLKAGGTCYRIIKQFGTNKSKFESKTPEGAWKVETTTCSEAHERTCGYAGGNDSAKGLHQLLWLTQAEFQLPDAKKFDSNVQAQLRGILGVLQTPLDDRFIERIKNRWSTWFSGQRKSGNQPHIKDSCKLAENLKKLEADQKGLQDSESKFNEVESLLRQAAEIHVQKLDLERQLGDQSVELQARRDEHQRSQARIVARQRAETDHAHAETERTMALTEQQQRADTAQRCFGNEKAIEPAREKVETIEHSVKAKEEERDRLRKQLGTERDQRHDLQNYANRVATKVRELTLAVQVATAKQDFDRAQEMANEIAQIERYLADHPAPDEATLKVLKNNRQQSSQLRANLEAASMSLTLVQEKGTPAAQLAVDGGPRGELPVSGEAIVRAVRRKAELLIGGWGRVELNRGTGPGDLDQIESNLSKGDEEFANTVTPLGISATDPQALDLIMQRVSEHGIRNPQLTKLKRELKQLAPKGLEPLHAKLVELQTKLADIPPTDPAETEKLPAQQEGLDKLATNLEQQMDAKDREIKRLETDVEKVDAELATDRQNEITAREELATCRANAKTSRQELERLRSDEQITQRVQAANLAVEESQSQLRQTELTDDERTIDQRLEAVQKAVSALEEQIRDNASKYDVIKGRLLESEGLHARRSTLAARVDEITRLTGRESLEKVAVDRLYALFEECREKQLGTLMGPIHDRVLNWMRVLDIGNYKEVRFNDAFLPDKLMSRDGTAEFTIQEESTGAQEQIGMLVRLALGSILASANEPAVAILDDPLTHCDIGRLNKMRVILRRVAEGDQNLTPPAGPLQIVILTCHPEWFRDERATVIDLQNAEVMSRWAV